MSIPTISTLPTPPTRSDAANFAVRADAFMAALPTFQSQTNAAITAMNQVYQPPALRNRIINGDMRIDQRNSGAAVTNANGYITDRWAASFNATSSGRATAQRVADAPGGFTFSFKVTVTATFTPTAVTSGYHVVHAIERQSLYDLEYGTASAKQVTLSFWVKSSVTGTYCAFLYHTTAGSGSPRANVMSYTITSANTWERKTITFSGDTGGTWSSVAENGLGLGIGFDLGSGTSRNAATAGTWATTAGDANARLSTQTSFFSTNGATFFLTGVQLERGNVASAFEDRPIAVELAMCLRYYYQVPTGYDLGITYNSGYLDRGGIPLPVPMRASPTASPGAAFSLNAGPNGTLAQSNVTPYAYVPYNSAGNWTAGVGASILSLGLSAEF